MQFFSSSWILPPMATMHPSVLFAALLLLLSLQHLHILPPCHAATADTLLPSQGLTGGDTLLSSNGRFALGFFQAGSQSNFSADGDSTPKWYLGIWFHTVPKLTPVWVANADNPVVAANLTSCKLVISHDGNLLVILDDDHHHLQPANGSSSSTVWSSKTNATTTNGTTTTTTTTTMAAAAASLLDNGNLVLHSASNASNIFWQSFDHPTDTLLQGGKIGWIHGTAGLVRRLVSRKNSVDQSPGVYSYELSSSSSSPSSGSAGSDTSIVSVYNSSTQYWSSGTWGGRYFSNIPETVSQSWLTLSFTTNEQETYVEYAVEDPTVLSFFVMDVSGQMKVLLWFEGSSTDWQTVYTAPKSQCDVYATCGAFTVCNDVPFPSCACMKGYSIRSPQDWELGDRTGGCARNTPLHCNTTTGGGAAGEPDKFYAMASVQLPADAQNVGTAKSEDECSVACLGSCSCTAYSYDDDDQQGAGGGCSIWHGKLLNVRQQGNSVLRLRLAAKEVETSSHTHTSRRGVIIGAAVGATTAATLVGFVFLVMIWVMRKRKRYGDDDVQGGIGIVAFRYADLQYATKNFSEKLGAGSFGSVFKGSLSDSTTIAVKRLDGVRQGEKQFRAEVSSTGVVQHVNLVKLIGFCCDGDRRLLVYEYMPNGSLDSHLFQSNGNGNGTVLDWTVRYQIALGVARGLAYLHASCRDCIIHCDIKPENILLDGSFTPKVADFGMAKFLGRDFSQVVTTMRGTIGYLALEWISGTAITSKVDVYSYGMVLLEIISGSRNASKQQSSQDGVHEAYFPVRVACGLVDGDIASLVDANLLGEANMEEVERVCKVACWCIQDVEFDRPTMSEVVQFLECLSEVETPPVPRFLQSIAGQTNLNIV
ncbi:G-type lectin S-receptor-like serine/threonine-protein kinase At2g19130 [Sorghum bicolor]|nr:G-type lectin S-receptor-like serine/threonine-protein kinase At2g19130 [Sorghum bicolor]|eukprot:XP_002445076.2 G-type lectin S-receptor-like serine/threonine-protein kinase At2g19130 [Sorghum bicolor]